MATLELAVFPVILGGRSGRAGAIRSVAVDPDWRGRGLFRDLMQDALVRIDAQHVDAVVLYTAEPALYGRFGFNTVAQHCFSGAAPPAGPRGGSRPLDLTRSDDRFIFETAIERRSPLSLTASLGVDACTIVTNVANDDAIEVVLAERDPSIIVFERHADAIALIDVIAPNIPPLARILGMLDHKVERVTTLFAPDQLGWEGRPLLEDTGLMMRGDPKLPDGPFMFPPTTEF